jgi:2-dehydro-3-deoxyphosphooctonate aldolase (KDO 8-P synthase)
VKPKQIVEIGDATSGKVRIGEGLPLAWICGPCVIEGQSLMGSTAERLKKLSEKLKVPLIFKSSYLKDNRSDELSYQGPGLDDGLEMLAWIRKEFELPVLSDVHSVEEMSAARRCSTSSRSPHFCVSRRRS